MNKKEKRILMSRYKVLILDLDGTLTNKNKVVSELTKKALDKAVKAGVKIVLASGRPTFGILPVAEAINLKEKGGYILSYNGGKIIDFATNETLYEQVIKYEEEAEILELAKKHKLDFACTENDSILLTNNVDNIYVAIEAGINKMKMKEVPDIENYLNFSVPKFVLFYDKKNARKEEIREVREKIYPDKLDYSIAIKSDIDYLADKEKIFKEKLGDKFEVYRSESFFLEVLPKGIDKAKSIAKLLEKLGLTKEEIIACGDGFNDRSMIEYAGLGVAMANAVDAVKEVADFITLSNEEDGVAYVIEKFILESDKK